MIHKNIFILALMLALAGFHFEIHAQTSPELLNADTLISQGISFHDEGKYDEAIGKFKLVHPSDSNYFWSQYELGLTYLAKKDYLKAIEISKKAIQDGSLYALQYNIWGTALDNMGKPEEAIGVYDMAIAKYPYNADLYFNKAVVYQIKGDIVKAKEIFRQLLSFSPHHPSSHLRIARLCKNDGLLTQAIMAYTMFLIFEPSSGRTLEVLSELNKLCDGSLKDIGSAKQKTFDQEYEEIDVLISNQVALNEKYKVPSSIKFPVIKQIYLLLEQIKEKGGTDQGFFASFYAPFFMQLKQTESYENFSLLILASSSNEMISKKVIKQMDGIRAVRNECLATWRKLHSSYTLSENGKQTQTDKWFRLDLSLQAFGQTNSNNENIGKWVYINNRGSLECLGQFENGKRTGVWTFFEPSGDTMKVLTFKNDKLFGKYKIYNKGLLSEDGYYKDELIDGIVNWYYPDGSRSARLNFSNDKRNGRSDYFYATGGLRTQVEYTNGVKNGFYKTYYENSLLNDSSGYVNGEFSGNYKEYYEDGKISRNFNYENGVIEGDYKTYYRNGNLKSSGFAAKGSVSGQWTYYYSNGKIKEKSTYDEKGKITGDSESYDLKGRKFELETYLKGDIKQITYFDEAGKPFYTFDPKKNNLLCEYDYQRFKTAEGPFKNMKREGIWKLYTASGALMETQTYKNEVLEGPYTTYHKNGKVKEQFNFVEGNKEGLYKRFYANGILETIGNYKSDVRWGVWYGYFKNGKIESEVYYLDDEIVGDAYYYNPDGKLSSKLKYNSDGLLIAKFNCDTSGRIIDSVLFKTGSAHIVLKGNSGKKSIECTYKNGYLHGPYKTFYPNGLLLIQGNYFGKYYNGERVIYHPNSKISSKGTYFHGEKNGKWEYFDYFGNLIYSSYYVNGLEHGITKWYYPDGKVESEIETYEDERNNKSTYYANNGDIREIRYYEAGLFVGYSYLNKNNEKVDTIFLKNGDGQVKAFYSNGNISTEYTISNGKYHNVYKIYFPDGKLQEERVYDHGEETGPVIKYFNNGKIMSKTNYCYGELCDEKLEYYPNGTLRLREHYLNNQLHGKAEYFNLDGKTVNAYLYYCNQLISVL